MIGFDFEKYCYGCRICEQICPVQAIRIISDIRGFALPQLDIDKCCQCGQCSRVCIHLNMPAECSREKARYYCASMWDRKAIAACTSGGVFHALAEECLAQDGSVCGCIWDEKFHAVHVLSDDRDTVRRMSGSKYLESDMGIVQTQVKQALDRGEKVLFSGTPCQTASIRALAGDAKNLVTMAIICEGVASPYAWERYKSEIEQEEGAELINVKMRAKELYGWDTPTSEYQFKHGKSRRYLSYATDPYIVPMLHGLFMRDSCTHCTYKGADIVADIIVGDYWGASAEQIQVNGNRGLSIVIVRTKKGQKALDDASGSLGLHEITENAARKNERLYTSIDENPCRQEFFEHLDEIGYKASLRKVRGMSWSQKVIDFMFKIGVYGIYRRIKRKW